jgi:hypothetical protein
MPVPAHHPATICLQWPGLMRGGSSRCQRLTSRSLRTSLVTAGTSTGCPTTGLPQTAHTAPHLAQAVATQPRSCSGNGAAEQSWSPTRREPTIGIVRFEPAEAGTGSPMTGLAHLGLFAPPAGRQARSTLHAAAEMTQWPQGRSSRGAVPSASPVIGTHLTGWHGGAAPLRIMCLVAGTIVGASSFALQRCPDSVQHWLCEHVQREAKLPARYGAQTRGSSRRCATAYVRSLSQLPSSSAAARWRAR